MCVVQLWLLANKHFWQPFQPNAIQLGRSHPQYDAHARVKRSNQLYAGKRKPHSPLRKVRHATQWRERL